MKFVEKLKKTGENILIRARHDDLLYLFLELAGGAIIVSMPPLGAAAIFIKEFQKHQKMLSDRQLRNSYGYFKKKGWINIESNKGNTIISLSREGRRRAELNGAGKILSRKVKEKPKWDGKWRIVMFDLANNKTTQRNAIRFFLKRCGFVLMQKSVWLYPYNCSKEIEFIRSFFGLLAIEFRFITCDDIEDDLSFKKFFGL